MRRLPLLVALLLFVFTVPSGAQIPDEFTNLQVLPKDISKRELVSTMRGIASALGVRCRYCHVGPDNLEGMDFATDRRKTKQAARRMMRMVKAINEDHLAGLETSEEARVEVECMTCHRGVAIPRQIEDIIGPIMKEDGFEAGMAKYSELRENHYGTAAYDFGPRPLYTLAEQLFRSGQQESAIELTRTNIELNPKSVWARVLLAGFHKERGENEKAIAAYEEALELDPDNGWVARQLEALRKTGDE